MCSGKTQVLLEVVSAAPTSPVTFIVKVTPLLLSGPIISSGGTSFQLQTYDDSLKGRLVGPVMLPSRSDRLPPQATGSA